MFPPIFATPDFGAGAGATCIILVLFLVAAAVGALVLFAVWRRVLAVKNPKRRAIIVLCLAIAAVGVSYGIWRHELKPYGDFKRLLAGDGNIQVEGVTFTGQGQRLALTEREATAYLTERLRSAVRDEFEGGVTYDARFALSTGSSVTCAIYIPTDKRCLTIRFPVESLNEGSYYLLALPEPIPDPLLDALTKLK